MDLLASNYQLIISNLQKKSREEIVSERRKVEKKIRRHIETLEDSGSRFFKFYHHLDRFQKVFITVSSLCVGDFIPLA